MRCWLWALLAVVSLAAPQCTRRNVAATGARMPEPAQETGPTPGLADFPNVRLVRLRRVSNASGLTLLAWQGRPVVATVDEVDEWAGAPEDTPPLITYSDPITGEALGGAGRIAEVGEVEALAVRDGAVWYPMKDGPQSILMRGPESSERLAGPELIERLRAIVAPLHPGPHWFELEGVSWHRGAWEAIASAVAAHARDTPRSTRAVLRVRVAPGGQILRVGPPVRWSNGALYTDYAASLDVLPSGVAIVGGFFRRGVVLVSEEGLVLRHIPLPTTRVEGVSWDPVAHDLYMVRECPGPGTDCSPVPLFGTPLWIAHIPEGLEPDIQASSHGAAATP